MPVAPRSVCPTPRGLHRRAHLPRLRSSERGHGPRWSPPGNRQGVNTASGAQRPHRLYPLGGLSPESEFQGDGSRSPGPEVHEAHPGPLGSTWPGLPPSPLPGAALLPAQAPPPQARGGSSGSTSQELCSSRPGVCPHLSSGGALGPCVSPAEFRSPSPARSGEKLRFRDG